MNDPHSSPLPSTRSSHRHTHTLTHTSGIVPPRLSPCPSSPAAPDAWLRRLFEAGAVAATAEVPDQAPLIFSGEAVEVLKRNRKSRGVRLCKSPHQSGGGPDQRGQTLLDETPPHPGLSAFMCSSFPGL